MYECTIMFYPFLRVDYPFLRMATYVAKIKNKNGEKYKIHECIYCIFVHLLY